MKKSLLLILLALGITAFVNAQWTVYDASVLPTDATPAWTISDLNSGPGAVYSINSVTKTLSYSSTPENRNAWKMTPKPVTNTATWIVRARANDMVDTAEYGMQFELNSKNTRIELRIGNSPKGGFCHFEGDGSEERSIYPADSTLNVSRYHIYRITMVDSVFKLYIDEDPTVVAEIKSSKSVQSQFLRFGFKESSNECAGFLNAMAWDTTGAYAPGEGTPLPVEFVSDAGNIVFAVNPTQDERDNGTITFLEELGYNVDTMNINRDAANLSTIVSRGEDGLNMLNAADLVIIGRSCQSDAYRNDRGAAIWNNKVTKPILNIHPYTARNPGNLLAWMSTNTAHLNVAPRGDTLYAEVKVAADPVFANSTIVGDSMVWSIAYDSYINADPLTNGELLVTYKAGGGAIFTRWEPGVKFFTGAPVHAWGAAPRTLFGFGNDQNGIINYWCLTENAQWVLKNEVNRLITTPYTVYAGSNDATLSAITVSEGTLSPAFAPATTEYTVELTEYVNTLSIAGVINEPVATVLGNSTVVIPPAGMTDSTIVLKCISSDASDTIDYSVTITVAPLELDVILISPLANGDVIQLKFLEENGINVTHMYPGKLAAASQGLIDTLNMADLIIIGRAGNSGDFGNNDSLTRAKWNNHITVPLIGNSPWHMRTSRLNWFRGELTSQNNATTGMTQGWVKDVDDPIFGFATSFTADSIEWSYLADDQIAVFVPINGDTVAYRRVNDSTIVPLIIRFTEDSAFYPGSLDTCRAPRTYFGFGNDAAGPRNYFPLSKDIQSAYLAEILRITGNSPFEPIYYVSADAGMSSLATTPSDTLKPAFSAGTLEYTLLLPKAADGKDSVIISFAATHPLATVTGNGIYQLTDDTTVISAYVRAENTRKGDTYQITVILIGTTDIDDVYNNSDAISVYPNPVKDKLFVNGLSESSIIRVLSISGQLLYQEKVTGDKAEINLSNLKEGVYIIQLEMDGLIVSKKIMKQ